MSGVRGERRMVWEDVRGVVGWLVASNEARACRGTRGEKEKGKKMGGPGGDDVLRIGEALGHDGPLPPYQVLDAVEVGVDVHLAREGGARVAGERSRCGNLSPAGVQRRSCVNRCEDEEGARQ